MLVPIWDATRCFKKRQDRPEFNWIEVENLPTYHREPHENSVVAVLHSVSTFKEKQRETGLLTGNHVLAFNLYGVVMLALNIPDNTSSAA